MTEEDILKMAVMNNRKITDFVIETYKMAWGYKQEIEAIIKKRERRELWSFILKASIIVIAIAAFISFALEHIRL